MSAAAAPLPGRSCGTCTLCCKVYLVAALDKPAGQWCRHCRPGQGCAVYETRPDQCRAFDCLWLTAAWLGPEWKPERAKFVLTFDQVTRALLVQVDHVQAGAWRKEPYYSQLKRWAAAGRAEGRRVVVFVGRQATLVLPDSDEPLGTVEPGARFAIREESSPHGVRYRLDVAPGA